MKDELAARRDQIRSIKPRTEKRSPADDGSDDKAVYYTLIQISWSSVEVCGPFLTYIEARDEGRVRCTAISRGLNPDLDFLVIHESQLVLMRREIDRALAQ